MSPMKIDDLPELPVELILSYLTLKDLLKLRAVSREWQMTVDRFKVKSLCFSECPSGFIEGKGRWLSGVFGQYFINSPKFVEFCSTFTRSILSNLKHLRLCDLRLKTNAAAFCQALHSFDHLQQLDIIRLRCLSDSCRELELSLSQLKSIQLVDLNVANETAVMNSMRSLTLDAPKLQNIKLLYHPEAFPTLAIVCSESVEKLITSDMRQVEVEKLNNLKYLYVRDVELSPGRLASLVQTLDQLEELHLNDCRDVLEAFGAKERYDRTDLKVFLCGVNVNGPDDPVVISEVNGSKNINYFTDPLKLADEIPFLAAFSYDKISSGLEIDMSRFSDLEKLYICRPIQELHQIDRFLNFLKNNLENIVELRIFGDQPHSLFNRLPEYCQIQRLSIFYADLYRDRYDLDFLFRLEHLTYLELNFSIGPELLRTLFEKLQFLSVCLVKCFKQNVGITIENRERFLVSVNGEKKNVTDLHYAIEFIEKKCQNKRGPQCTPM